MKRIMIAMLSLMLTLPIMAQYGRPRYYGSTYGRSTYTRTSYRHNPVNSYFGFRIGGAFSTVSSDDKYLDGGTMRTGLNVGVVGGFPEIRLSCGPRFEHSAILRRLCRSRRRR